MISTEQIQQAHAQGAQVVGEDGTKIGSMGQVYLDDKAGQPEWVTVSTGMFGTSESFVPLAQATLAGDQLTVPYGKDKIKDAPRVDADGHITPEQEADLYRHYGLEDPDSVVAAPVTGERTQDGEGAGHDTSGPDTDDAMTRSEEQLEVGTQTRETGKARLRKYIVTEQQTVTVPVTREEVRIEREPITDVNRGDAIAGGDLTEEEHEVVLHEEQVVVDKQAVPVERVRMGTETVTEDQQVTEDVRKEVIETEGQDVSLRDADRQPKK